ncbi:hypothetical protein Rsub_07659 [Raphidocelis subcapitata]|uniref:Uncharacterized protein n=1 Tax=Raphidocelis subcapitata TaxID=307507 RepID=A0A2V0P4J6_9CHLO|nr:hypothetical protein Rsub_07659 [Raphidocelis subcapitata]|eukprot:GBF94776.1 hypothetical protein Rsub_07659 [Raphidocelis subcapitata]
MSTLTAEEAAAAMAAVQAELAAAAGVPVSAVSAEAVQAVLAALEAEGEEEDGAQQQQQQQQQQPAAGSASSAAATPPAASGDDEGGGRGAADDDGASYRSEERVVIKSSAGPEPFPGIRQLPPRVPAEPGQVLIRFDLEEGHCWELSRTGWCCVFSLACTMPIFCCLPCFAPCSLCRARFQRPVYGWPLGCHAEIIASPGDGDKAAGAGGEGGEAAAAAGGGVGGGGRGSGGLREDAPRPAALQIISMPPAASPSPQSIFVPPSAVPLTGFSIPSPGYPRYKMEPPGSRSGPNSAPATPRSGFPTSPNAGGAGAAPRSGSPLAAPVWPQQLSQLPHRAGAQGAGPAPQEGHQQAGGNAPATPEHARPPAARTARSQQSAQSLGTWGSRQNSRHISLDGATFPGLP